MAPAFKRHIGSRKMINNREYAELNYDQANDYVVNYLAVVNLRMGYIVNGTQNH